MLKMDIFKEHFFFKNRLNPLGIFLENENAGLMFLLT